MVNHYGFAGRQSFRGDFRVLVAGGGTGDATIFLAEQLRAVLAEDGVLGLMVYATCGRTGAYQMQSLLRLVEGDATPVRERIEDARQILCAAPRTNWFKRGEDLYGDHRNGDAGVHDLLLQSQDRSYSVGELHEWIDRGHRLHLEFTDVQRGPSAYLPHLRMGTHPPRILAKIRALPLERQQAIAELLGGDIKTHSFYATRGRRVAPYGDADYVPILFHEPVTGAELAEVFARSKGRPFALEHSHSGVSVTVSPGRFAPAILRRIDGERSFREIFEGVRADPAFRAEAPGDAALFEDFRASFEVLSAIDRLLLRHAGASPAPRVPG